MNHQFSYSKIASKAAAVVALGFMAATSAQADIVPSGGVTTPIDLALTGPVFGGYEIFTSTGTLFNNIQYQAGSLQLATSSPSGSFATYCVELTQTASTSSYQYNLTNFTPSVAAGLSHLYQVAGSPTNKPDSAAFQAAVWEIVYETSGSYGLGSGQGVFQGSFSSASINTQAAAWLTAVNGLSAQPAQYIAQQYVNDGHQDYLVISVPEPESYALLLAGLGLIGTIARRRSQQKVA